MHAPRYLCTAVFHDQLSATQALLAGGVDVNFRDEDTDKPSIFVAVEQGHTNILRC